MFQLSRTLISLDLETTGVNPSQDRIIEIGIVSVRPDGSRKEWSSLVNPGIPIPPDASRATRSPNRPDGITNDLVSSAPPFSDFAANIAHGTRDVDFIGFNLRSFDLPLLYNELRRCGHQTNILNAHVVDAMKIYHDKRKRDLSAFVQEMLGEKHLEAHEALPDARNTLDAMIAMLEKFPDLPRTPAEIHNQYFGNVGNKVAGGKFEWKNGSLVCTFGKHANTAIQNIPKHYMEWVLRQDTFDPNVKALFRDALDGRYPTKPGNDPA